MSDNMDKNSPISVGESSNSASGASSNLQELHESNNVDECDLKKTAAQLIKKYYNQLLNGCGNVSCDNPNCASSGKVESLSNNDAAVKALQLLSEQAKLCETSSSLHSKSSSNVGRSFKAKYTRGKHNHSSHSDSLPSPDTDSEMEHIPLATNDNKGGRSNLNNGFKSSSSSSSSSSTSKVFDRSFGLTEVHLKNIIDNCRISNNYAPLRILLRTAFSCEGALRRSFLIKQEKDKIKDKRKSIDSEIKFLDIGNDGVSKEELRSAESDLDKDVDCQEESCEMEDKEMVDVEEKVKEKETNNTKDLKVDIESIRRSYEYLFTVPESEFNDTLMDAIRQLCKDNLSIQISVFPSKFRDPSSVNIFIILLENPQITSSEYTDEVLGEMCKVMAHLDDEQQASLVHYIAENWDANKLHRFLESLHQLITIRILTTEFSRDFTINNEEVITSTTRVMKIIFYASIVAGELDYPLVVDLPSPEIVVPSEDSFTGVAKDSIGKPPPWDSLGKYLGLHVLDSSKPAISFEDFYDDFLSDQLEMDRDFAVFKSGESDQFSFLSYPFILTPATKSLGLYYDNRIRMYSERRISLYQTVMEGTPANPYLTLRIRRDHIIEDALVELELVALENPGDLKKQLVVEFEGEQGIDEGGVSKEFFQLFVDKVFNPDFAMFCLNSETKTFWFNPTSFENDAQFTLVGVVLGLAIYNNVILDLHFPPVVYKKLCGKPGTFKDLRTCNITLYNSLIELLNYEENDMEEIFLQTFRVGYQDIFGASLVHDLRPDGNNIFVNQQNKKEFVSMYADFLLNKNVERQFSAFKRGFSMVTDDSPLLHLFRPQELELLVCGSQNYDFAELRKSTEYDGGYNASSPIISWFWELVDKLGSEEKKQLLQFVTGSARVPVGGLARLKFTIARNGPDTERLPTAHTCFNVLLLPEYSSKEKLNDRLMKAIKYAEGFGML
ncbi:UNVERIFIED_CONTAM: hypothetical protein RMT77_009710 [Armadillidium vulgare]